MYLSIEIFFSFKSVATKICIYYYIWLPILNISVKWFTYSFCLLSIFVSFDTTYDPTLKCTELKVHFIIWKHFHSNDDTCVHTTPLFCCYVSFICTKNRCFIFVCFSDKTRLKTSFVYVWTRMLLFYCAWYA